MEIKVLASGSSGNCYFISDGSSSLLLDAGLSIRQIRIGCDFRLAEVSAVLITHHHGDHSKAVKDLLYAGYKVCIPRLEAEQIPLVFGGKRIHFLKHTEDEYEPFQAGSFCILPFRVQHDTPEPVGYLIGSNTTGEKLLYFTDTYYLRYRFSGMTHIIGECNYDDETLQEHLEQGLTPSARAKRLFTSHMSLHNLMDFLRASDLSRLQQIYLCHMSDDHSNEARIRTAIQRLTGAEVYIC